MGGALNGQQEVNNELKMRESRSYSLRYIAVLPCSYLDSSLWYYFLSRYIKSVS